MSAAATGTDGRLLVERRFFTFAESADGMALDSGARLGPITLAYETLGAHNADRSNANLVLHAITGDAPVAGVHTNGAGRGFFRSPAVKHGAWCSGVIQSCHSSSTNNKLTTCRFHRNEVRDLLPGLVKKQPHRGVSPCQCAARMRRPRPPKLTPPQRLQQIPAPTAGRLLLYSCRW